MSYSTYSSSGTTTATWTSWTTGYHADSTASTNIVWTQWSGAGASTASATTTTTTATLSEWSSWVYKNQEGYAFIDNPQVVDYPQFSSTPETEEQKLARETAAAERKQKEEAKAKKARQLLKEVLTEKQDKQLEEKGYFELVSVKSGQRYRVNKGRSRNVQKLDANGVVVKHLCFHPADAVHDYDTMAIQAIMLQHDEEAVQKVANFS